MLIRANKCVHIYFEEAHRLQFREIVGDAAQLVKKPHRGFEIAFPCAYMYRPQDSLNNTVGNAMGQHGIAKQ
jgi:hypothetical protein